MKDIQNQCDHRKIDINRVGVKGIRYPIVVLDRVNELQHTVATINMYVRLPHHFKGTHMSRFIEVLNRYRHGISTKNIMEILGTMREKLDSESAHMELSFPFFIEKAAPVTGAKSLMGYTCHMRARRDTKTDLVVGVDVPVTALCPCSREISNYGAHNQRSVVRVRVRFSKFFWIEDLISLVERSASSDIFPLLKRPDEKYVTEQAYNNPMFVEDIVRTIAQQLDSDDNITWYSIEAENQESIHNHNACAYVEKAAFTAEAPEGSDTRRAEPPSVGKDGVPEPTGGSISALARDPFWIFCYWDVPAQPPRGAGYVLRVFDVSDDAAQHCFDLPVSEASARRYIQVPCAGRRYRIELCRSEAGGGFVCCCAASVEPPPATVSATIDPDWAASDRDFNRIYELSGGDTVGSGQCAGSPGVPENDS